MGNTDPTANLSRQSHRAAATDAALFAASFAGVQCDDKAGSEQYLFLEPNRRVEMELKGD